MGIWVYKDKQGWYQKLFDSLQRLGIHSRIFLEEQEIDITDNHPIVFIHMTHYGVDLREQNKQLVEKLTKRNNLCLIPTIVECRLYDNKILQYKSFPDWMPKTWYITNFEEAIKIIDIIEFPFISKASEGAGSSNVRFIENRKQALEEDNKVFKEDGITCWLKNKQKGYLLWQKFIPGNSNDWRVILLAKKYAMILKRYNRPDIPFASGSGNMECIQEISSIEHQSALEYTRAFAEKFDFVFLGVDILFDKKNKPIILETTTGWGFDAYSNCRIFEFTKSGWVPTQYKGRTMFDLVAKLITTNKFER